MRKPRPAGWSAALTRPLPTKDGQLISTLAQARALTLANEKNAGRNEWQSTAGKLLQAAKSGSAADIEAATDQLHLALFLSGRLKL